MWIYIASEVGWGAYVYSPPISKHPNPEPNIYRVIVTQIWLSTEELMRRLACFDIRCLYDDSQSNTASDEQLQRSRIIDALRWIRLVVVSLLISPSRADLPFDLPGEALPQIASRPFPVRVLATPYSRIVSTYRRNSNLQFDVGNDQNHVKLCTQERKVQLHATQNLENKSSAISSS